MGPAFLSELARRNRYNLRTLRRSPAAEISGALGDLGTLLPLMIALALQGSIDLTSTLIFSGLFNIATGVVFGIPLPVQPMKAIAAAALANHLPLRVTTAAGALVSFAVLLLSATGLLRLLARLIPVPIIKGIQLGAGLRLITSGAALILPLPWLAPPPLDSRLAALLLFLLLLLTQRAARFPYALLAFLLGIAVAEEDDDDDGSAAAPAVPSATALGLSVAAMNLLACWSGAMPVCHGAGGLAAQHRFGARSGASVVLLGLAKVLLGVWGSGARSGSGWGLLQNHTGGQQGLIEFLRRFPGGVLGVMVIAAGLELAKVGAGLNSGAADLWEESVAEGEGVGVGFFRRRRCREVGVREQQERWMVMMVTAAGILAFKNDAVGFLAGCCCHAAYRAADCVERRQAEGRWGLVGERLPLLR
ncbi:uncharacterized protein THITE_2152701 [Thermothielavioides terrestris NRRL 8126]|uniref:Sulfate transporter n=1 Tax=Thermothielavioides terrestris (strain ATCC 38088 / NRRL 8126) TaxID=578455 RepID=G2QXQ4_THETT|nr:uncharacterized protein THITE_2152701 [Thermothielavioides terrestris NRRL 8126]AEO62372.1 hypothetical protein THITE_2152701 [Thermothielavioides terrestris NRRL 8126]